MPGRNTVRIYAKDTYYHVYNRGVEKRKIFLDESDYATFLNLLKRYLGQEDAKDRFGRPYKDLSQAVELLAFCLMPNHIHLLIFQKQIGGITNLMQRLLSSHSSYFNKKYNRAGVLFQSRFKATNLDNDSYFWHISRYIHLNPTNLGIDLNDYTYSSYPYYVGKFKASWIKPNKILQAHREHKSSYEEFVKDFYDYKKTLDEIKWQLADY